MRDVDLASFRNAVGPAGCAEGTAAVRRGAVVQMSWDASQQLLTGTVRDGGGDLRTVSAAFRASAGFPLRFRAGHCSCAVGINCAHVAALILAATDETLMPEPEPVPRRSALPWEQSLDSLLGTPRPPADADGEAGVAGALTWARLDYLLLRAEYPTAQVRLLHELYALYRASVTAKYSYYGYAYAGDQRHLDLSGCESRQLWPVLEHAHAIGLPLVYPHKRGTVPAPGVAELCLDVTSDGGDEGGEGTTLLIAPVIKTGDGGDVVPLGFIGSEGHGVVVADRAQAHLAEHARFGLARLT